jgi:hypothetical protein
MSGASLLVVPALVTAVAATRPSAPPPADAPLAAAERRAVVEELARVLRTHYLHPDLAERTARALLQRLARGQYLDADPDAFASALTRDLQAATGDRRCQVRFDPDFRGSIDPDAEPSPAEKAGLRRVLVRQNFGVSKVEVLPGNVGLLDLRFFAPAELAAPTLAAAMSLLASTQALIVDLRQNDGGDPETIAFLCTYFFPQGKRVHLNDLYYRSTNETRQWWTQPSVPGPRYTGRPVYVLTSPRTFGGAEEMSYDLQAQKRALILGEPTGGGANQGGGVPLRAGFVAFFATARAINPVTKTNWERVGVKPDLAVPAPQALDAAHAHAVRTILKTEPDEDYRNVLQRLLAMLVRGERERPNYRRQ